MKFLPVIIFVLASLCSFAQETYYVVHLNGEIKKNNNEIVKVRDKISTEDQLTFSSKEDFLVVFSSTSGRKIIRPENKNAEPSSFVSYFVKENLFPLKKGISTRGALFGMNSLTDLTTYLKNPIIVVERHEVMISPGEMGLNDQSYLVAADSIPLPITDSSLVIDRSFPEGSFPLSLLDKEYDISYPCGNLVVIHQTKDDLLAEIAYYQELSGRELDKKGVESYLKEVMGYIGESDLQLLFD